MYEKTIVRRIGAFTVFEGDVETEVGAVTFCWVERGGVRVSPLTDIDEAIEIAEIEHEKSLDEDE